MFAPGTYAGRREALRREIKSGIAVFPGNTEAAFNYPANTYHFRQDSTFLYFFGINQPDLAAVIDLDNGQDYLFGNDVDMDDIIWMGPQPTMKERGELVGVSNTRPFIRPRTPPPAPPSSSGPWDIPGCSRHHGA